MPVVHIPDRTLISVAGPDAFDFLQNIVTTDLAALGRDEAKPGALLAPQGKILFDFLISFAGADTLRLEIRSEVADDFVRRLSLYKLRAKVEIAKQDQAFVAVRFGNDSATSRTESAAPKTDPAWLKDSRFAAEPAWRGYGTAVPATAGLAEWHAFRIDNGVAESGTDYALGDAFPHDVLLDQNGGVGFKKGCYVGQEVVSRMQHRGTARRRVLIVESPVALPGPGTDILVGERSVGALGTTAGQRGLAIVRIDRVKDAMDAGTPITAAGVPLTLAIPAFATFGFPETADTGDA